MAMMKKAGALGVAKMVYDQARKPQNQARIKDAVAKLRARRNGSRPR